MPAEFSTGFQEINANIFSSSSNTIVQILESWPNILIAIGVLLIGAVCMWLVQFLVEKIIQKIPFHSLSEKTGFTDFLQKAEISSSPSTVVAKFLGGYIFTMFFLAAAKILELNAISDFLDKTIKYIPNVIVALFIVLLGSKFAQTLGAVVESTVNAFGIGTAKILRFFATYVIIFFAIITALFQLNIANDLVKILFIAFVSMIALAGGIALGLGSKDFVHELLSEMTQFKKKIHQLKK